MTTTERKTLGQQRALHAYAAVQEIMKDRSKAKEYQREAHKLPVRALTAGLGQSLAFLHAKAKDKKPALKHLLDDLGGWVLGRLDGGGGSLIQAIVEGDAVFLRRATDETLAYLEWLNRFLEAELGRPDASEGGLGHADPTTTEDG